MAPLQSSRLSGPTVRAGHAQAERTAKLQELLALEAELKETQAALEQYADNDPSRVEAMSAHERRRRRPSTPPPAILPLMITPALAMMLISSCC